MIDWQPILTQPTDGQPYLFWSPLGEAFIAPGVDRPGKVENRAAQKIIYLATGEWPQAGYEPTHWAPINPPEDQP